jgi:protocatechuate 3,4-dioxygenase beta subunit
MKMVTEFIAVLLVAAGCASLAVVAAVAAPEWQCPPTKADALGPFYTPNAPERSSVGKGYLLQGVVKSARNCAGIPGAKIEFWLAGPDGNYDDAHRATVLTDKAGAYRFESNFPPKYTFRPPHIHVKVTAPGFRDLVTQHYPQKGEKQGTFDLVLIPVA